MTVAFAASDALSKAAKTEYSTGGGATWTSGATAPISAQGITTLRYRSSDNAGNTEADQTTTVRIDSVKPVPRALANKTVKKGKKVSLRYRVHDKAGPRARVKIKIYKGAKLRKTLSLGLKATNGEVAGTAVSGGVKVTPR